MPNEAEAAHELAMSAITGLANLVAIIAMDRLQRGESLEDVLSLIVRLDRANNETILSSEGRQILSNRMEQLQEVLAASMR